MTLIVETVGKCCLIWKWQCGGELGELVNVGVGMGVMMAVVVELWW